MIIISYGSIKNIVFASHSTFCNKTSNQQASTLNRDNGGDHSIQEDSDMIPWYNT